MLASLNKQIRLTILREIEERDFTLTRSKPSDDSGNEVFLSSEELRRSREVYAERLEELCSEQKSFLGTHIVSLHICKYYLSKTVVNRVI